MLCITYIESLSNQTVLRRLYFVFGIWMIFWIWIVLWSYVRFWHASSIVQKSYLLNLAAQEYYAFGVLMREKSGLIFWPRYFLSIFLFGVCEGADAVRQIQILKPYNIFFFIKNKYIYMGIIIHDWNLYINLFFFKTEKTHENILWMYNRL